MIITSLTSSFFASFKAKIAFPKSVSFSMWWLIALRSTPTLAAAFVKFHLFARNLRIFVCLGIVSLYCGLVGSLSLRGICIFPVVVSRVRLFISLFFCGKIRLIDLFLQVFSEIGVKSFRISARFRV